jgi:hypothetical protein
MLHHHRINKVTINDGISDEKIRKEEVADVFLFEAQLTLNFVNLKSFKD